MLSSFLFSLPLPPSSFRFVLHLLMPFILFLSPSLSQYLNLAFPPSLFPSLLFTFPLYNQASLFPFIHPPSFLFLIFFFFSPLLFLLFFSHLFPFLFPPMLSSFLFSLPLPPSSFRFVLHLLMPFILPM